MTEILDFIKSVIAHPMFQGILGIVSSAGFITVIGMIGKLFGNKRVNKVVNEVQTVLGEATGMVEQLNQRIDELQAKIDEANENAATSKEMTKTYILNSKAAASTKNEVLKIDATPQTGNKEVVVVKEENIPVYEDTEEVKPEEKIDAIDELVNKL